jgi:hypothetical protein
MCRTSHIYEGDIHPGRAFHFRTDGITISSPNPLSQDQLRVADFYTFQDAQISNCRNDEYQLKKDTCIRKLRKLGGEL